MTELLTLILLMIIVPVGIWYGHPIGCPARRRRKARRMGYGLFLQHMASFWMPLEEFD